MNLPAKERCRICNKPIGNQMWIGASDDGVVHLVCERERAWDWSTPIVALLIILAVVVFFVVEALR